MIIHNKICFVYTKRSFSQEKLVTFQSSLTVDVLRNHLIRCSDRVVTLILRIISIKSKIRLHITVFQKQS